MRLKLTLRLSACIFLSPLAAYAQNGAGFASAADASAAAPATSDVRSDVIVVTASPIGRTTEETISNTTVLSNDDLQDQMAATIGETLRTQPGISSSFFGPGASRPIIRGLSGDRIAILDSGIGSIDASSASPDHAVAIEPATAERIEIVRGAASLLYGSTAAGGAINVINGRIPSRVPENGVDGALRIGGSTVDSGVETAGDFNVKLADVGSGALVFHGEGGYREAEDYKIPGFEHSARLRAIRNADPNAENPDGNFGKELNTGLNSHTETIGLSYVGDAGFACVSGTLLNSFYGVPGSDEALPDGAGPHIDLEQKRIDFNSEFDNDFLIFKKTRLRFGYADYKHTEIEPSGDPGTVFANEGYEGRLELVDKTADLGAGQLNGAFGFQFRKRDFSAIGEESFVPETKTRENGIFGLQDYQIGNIRFEASGRIEKTKHTVISTGNSTRFTAYSVSGGVGYEPFDGVFFGVTGLRTERAPQSEELFANGPHLATGIFELGDPTLAKEIARGGEATIRLGGDNVAFTLNGFYTSYKDFITETDTGTFADVDGELVPIFQFQPTDAKFRGLESKVEAELFHAGPFDIHADAAVSYVRATAVNSSTGNLPRIPPLSGLFGVEAESDFAKLRVEADYNAQQDKLGPGELPTDSFTMYNAYMTLRPFKNAQNLAVRFDALNLTNEEARLHSSFLKEVAPLPGRNFRVSLRGEF